MGPLSVRCVCSASLRLVKAGVSLATTNAAVGHTEDNLLGFDTLSQASTDEDKSGLTRTSTCTMDSISDDDHREFPVDAVSNSDQESLASADTGELATCGDCRSICTAELREFFEDQGSFSDCDSLVWSDDNLSDVFSMVDDDMDDDSL
jgi:hypothetical protein